MTSNSNNAVVAGLSKWVFFAVAVLVAMAPIAAMAVSAVGNNDDSAPPDGRLEGWPGTVVPESGSALTYMFMVVLTLITAGILFMNAKRSHLD